MIVIDLIKKLETFNPLMEVMLDVTPTMSNHFLFVPVQSVESCEIQENDGDVVVISRILPEDWENEEDPFNNVN